MQKLILLLLVMSGTTTLNAQFKADNVKYTTVFPDELCKTLQSTPGYTLLDVRSQGEVDDTSSSAGLNIGHLKNSLHIDIRELPGRWKELLAYRNKPLFIYCSHSQRSRRASRLLADSGFTKVYNINGGLTDFYYQGIEANLCPGLEIVTTVPYKILSAKEFASNRKQGKSYYIVDLRSDSVFKGIANEERTRVEGHFDDAISIPFEKLTSAPALPAKPLLLVDEDGDLSPKAAKWLIERGYKDVNILFGGMQDWVDYVTNASEPPDVKWTRNINYGLLSAEDLSKMVSAQKQFSLIDVRTKDEYSNASKYYWQNIGQIKGSVNIPFAEINGSPSLPASKESPVVIYGFNNQANIFEAAKKLKDLGYKNVSVLEGGIWRIRWTAHNIKGRSQLNELVVNVPAENE